MPYSCFFIKPYKKYGSFVRSGTAWSGRALIHHWLEFIMWYSFSTGNLGDLFKSLKNVPTLIHLTVHLMELSKEIIRAVDQDISTRCSFKYYNTNKTTNKEEHSCKLHCHVLEGYIMIEMHVKEMDTKLCCAKMFVCGNTQDWKKYTKIVVVIPCWCNYE